MVTTIKISASITDFGETSLGFEIIGRDAKRLLKMRMAADNLYHWLELEAIPVVSPNSSG